MFNVEIEVGALNENAWPRPRARIAKMARCGAHGETISLYGVRSSCF